MAGDWIKVECVTPDKPEVDMMANHLGIDHDSVVGKLLRLWIWADQQSISGNGLSVTKTMIDRITFVTGFCDALKNVGWIDGEDGNYSLTNFEKHNGSTAKDRAATNRRVAKSRAKAKSTPECNGESVTNLLQKPLPEKRRDREESILNNNNPPTKLKLDVSELDNIDPRAKQSILEWIEYKTSIKKPMKQPALKKLLKSSPQAIITAVDASIMNGYQGLFPEKYESKQQQYTAPSRDLTKPTMS